MIGVPADFVRRLKECLPRRWFGDHTPVLDQVLGGPAAALHRVYATIQEARRQTRVHLASGSSLDALARDYLGFRIVRRVREDDESFRARVTREVLRSRATRSSVISVLEDLTGRPPLLFEPSLPTDTGGYGTRGTSASLGLAYGVVGGWGSLLHPNQCFITAFRPIGSGSAPGLGWGAGGYSTGYNAYADVSVLHGNITDADIQVAVRGVLPAGTVAWLRISS